MLYDWNSANRRQTGPVATDAGLDALVSQIDKLPDAQRAAVLGRASAIVARRNLIVSGNERFAAGLYDNESHGNTVERALAGEFLRAVLSAPRGLAMHVAQTDIVRRALSTEAEGGGYLIPPFVGQLLKAPPAATALFDSVTKIPVKSNTGWFPVDANNLVFTWGTEGETIDTVNPTVGRVEFTIGKMCGITRASNEWAADGIDAINFVLGVFAQAAAAAREHAIAIGTGSGQPMGLFSATGVVDVSGTSLTYDAVVNLRESVDLRFQSDPSFAFFGNQRVRAALQKIKDSNNRPIFTNDATTAFKDMLLGHPYRTNRYFPNSFIGVGALSQYLWFDRQMMSVATSREAGDTFATDSVLIRLTERADGRVPELASEPFARMKNLSGIS